MSESIQVACPSCLAPNRVAVARVAEAPKCGKCGAPNRVKLPLGEQRAQFTCKECGLKQRSL